VDLLHHLLLLLLRQQVAKAYRNQYLLKYLVMEDQA
jgi:hypothetical protein